MDKSIQKKTKLKLQNSLSLMIGKAKFVNKINVMLVLLFAITSLFSQTTTEVVSYFNKTNLAIYKAQKELLSHPEINVNKEFSEVLIAQLNAKQLFDEKNLNAALGYSNVSRKKCIDLFSKFKVPNYEFYLDTPEEKSALKTIDVNISSSNKYQPSNDILKQVSELDVKDPQQIHSKIINLK